MMRHITWLWFLLRTAARSCARTPRRTLFSLGGVAAATAAIIIFQSFVTSISASTRESVIKAHYGHYEIMRNGYERGKVDDPYAYQITDYERLKERINAAVGPLAFASRRLEFYGLLSYNDRSVGAIGLGIDAAEEKKFMTLAQVTAGVHLADSDARSGFLGAGLAEALRVKVGDSVTALVTTSGGSINAVDLTITGIFRTGVPDLDERTIYVHQPLAEELLHVKGAPRILIAFQSNDELQYRQKLDALLKAEFPGLRASHWLERASFYENLMDWLHKQVFVFYVIVLTIATISIANIFSMGLLERTGEFGTLRAIGTGRGEITALIFAESMLQALAGSLIGVVAGLALILGPLRPGITMPPLPMMSVPFHVTFGMPWHDILPTIALCAGVAGMSGILPALKMARINIVTALGRNV
jgi:putative ABC transport system permease protein